jgi:hypothetical protein
MLLTGFVPATSVPSPRQLSLPVVVFALTDRDCSLPISSFVRRLAEKRGGGWIKDLMLKVAVSSYRAASRPQRQDSSFNAVRKAPIWQRV